MPGSQESLSLQTKTKAHRQVGVHHVGALGVLLDCAGVNSRIPDADLMTL